MESLQYKTLKSNTQTELKTIMRWIQKCNFEGKERKRSRRDGCMELEVTKADRGKTELADKARKGSSSRIIT
jgi:hypothetical protein